MTPNIHAHYTDHGQLQFCSIIIEDNVEINFGATSFDPSNGEPIVLFGHSFGAIVAFEVARHLEERGMQPEAVFVSASVPPSKTPLVETAVSTLSTDEICNYFASKGNPVSDVLRSTPFSSKM
jgi:surfactin synthase thioesterase subunit